MKRIKITENQYKKLVSYINENKQILNETDDTIKSDLNILLMISKLLGISLSGLNKIKLENALKNVSVYENLKTTLESKEKLQELIESLELKGMKDSKIKLKNNVSSIISKFNTLAKNNNFDIRMSPKVMTNLNSLEIE